MPAGVRGAARYHRLPLANAAKRKPAAMHLATGWDL